MRRIVDYSTWMGWGRWRLPWLDVSAFDVRSDREKARDYLSGIAAGRIEEYLDGADEATVRDLFHRAGMVRKRDRTPRERFAAGCARIAQFIFFGMWGLFALHLLTLI